MRSANPGLYRSGKTEPILAKVPPAKGREDKKRPGKSLPMKFQVRLTAHGPKGAWTFLEVPFDVQKAFGSKARVAVCGTINGYSFRNSLMPNGDGTHSMMVNRIVQAGANAKAGDRVAVVMAVDTKKRAVPIPRELKNALAGDAAAAAIFKTLSPSHRKEFADWITSAKLPATKLARSQKSLKFIRERAHVR